MDDLMRKDLEKIAVYMRALGISPDVDAFSDRIKIQKFAYLFEKLFPRELSYKFLFMIRGPYCRELTDDYYADKKIFTSSLQYHMKEETGEIERLKDEGMGRLTSEQLEIMASMLYLKDQDGMNEDAAIKKLLELKSYFKLDEVISGLNKLKEFMLTDAERKRLLPILEKEMVQFDKASAADLRAFEKSQKR